MLTIESEWRELLSPEGKELFDDVNLQRVLGASTHIRLIGDLFLNISETQDDAGKMLDTVCGIAKHFSETRGESSQAISNAIMQMTRKIGGENRQAVTDSIREGVETYRVAAANSLQRIKEYLWTLLEDKRNLLLFDYSSTVAAIAEMGREKGVTFCCYIPESRVLDGGRPYVLPFLRAGHHLLQ